MADRASTDAEPTNAMAEELPPFEHAKTNPSWGRSLDHLLYGCEFMAKGRDWKTTEIIRRKLQAHDNAKAATTCPDCGAKINPMLYPCLEQTCPVARLTSGK